ncbi:MAG: histidinol-phosphate transaminase [Oscillospiraceae bacterium]|nr:histidinol-phosphate transaminase [Oscillospiraceae bacterium]
MSRYFSDKFGKLIPYTPGEQPRDMQYVKLNTNESPFPPAPGVAAAAAAEAGRLQLYSDPECKAITEKLAATYGVSPRQVLVGNGSDEVLNFAFMAFADEKRPLLFPDITYGFYPVFAKLNHIPYEEIPLTEDFRIDPEAYLQKGKVPVIANPNAPTGMTLPLEEIERIVRFDTDRVVIVDEAYVDFGGESAVGLVSRYDNLLVTMTFSKSRSLAGGRLGFAIGSEELIRDLNTLKYSTNPYNVNRMTAAAGCAALDADDYHRDNCRKIMENRAWTTAALEEQGFSILPSAANFIFARSQRIGGEELYRSLKARGVLVRHFDKDRIRDFVRITIGTREQMETLVNTVESILKERAQ